MVRISEIHTDGRAAKTYLAAPGRPDLDLLPHEVVGCALLVDYRRHCHDAFLLHATAIWLRGSQLSRANSSAHAELSSIDEFVVLAKCPLLALSGHHDPLNRCPLLGVKRTSAECG